MQMWGFILLSISCPISPPAERAQSVDSVLPG